MSSNNFVENEDSGKLGAQFMPVGFSNKRHGWDGDHLEYEREEPTFESKSSHVAVDLEQFRNQKIGVGYQAKNVIRQRSVPHSSVVIHNRTLHSTSSSNSKKRKSDESDTKLEMEVSLEDRLQKYIMCKGMRKFRNELASIESST
jgi:hypothetical protein